MNALLPVIEEAVSVTKTYDYYATKVAFLLLQQGSTSKCPLLYNLVIWQSELTND